MWRKILTPGHPGLTKQPVRHICGALFFNRSRETEFILKQIRGIPKFHVITGPADSALSGHVKGLLLKERVPVLYLNLRSNSFNSDSHQHVHQHQSPT